MFFVCFVLFFLFWFEEFGIRLLVLNRRQANRAGAARKNDVAKAEGSKERTRGRKTLCAEREEVRVTASHSCAARKI